MHLYGILIALSLALAAFLCTREERRLGLPRDTGLDIVLYALPPAIVAARLYYVAFTWEYFSAHPERIIRVWEGGLAIYGAVIGGAAGLLFLAKRRGLPFLQLADVVAPSLLLGQAIGRWGNFFNGEAFGYAVDNPAFQFFPFAVQVQGGWHLATFFYESLWNALGFLFLYLNRVRFEKGRHGHVFFWYLVWYGLGRLLIEGLRTDSLMLGGVRVSQLLSLILVCAALVKLLIDHRLHKLWLALPLTAPAAAFLLPGWAGILAAWACLAAAAIRLYPACGGRNAAA